MSARSESRRSARVRLEGNVERIGLAVQAGKPQDTAVVDGSQANKLRSEAGCATLGVDDVQMHVRLSTEMDLVARAESDGGVVELRLRRSDRLITRGSRFARGQRRASCMTPAAASTTTIAAPMIPVTAWFVTPMPTARSATPTRTTMGGPYFLRRKKTANMAGSFGLAKQRPSHAQARTSLRLHPTSRSTRPFVQGADRSPAGPFGKVPSEVTLQGGRHSAWLATLAVAPVSRRPSATSTASARARRQRLRQRRTRLPST